MSPSFRVLCLPLSLLVLLAACGPASTPPPPTVVEVGKAPATPGDEAANASSDEAGVEELLARANIALEADQLFDPAGSSALDLYLAARESASSDLAATGKQARRLSDAMAQVDPREQIQLAIADIFPFGLIWVERAIADNRRVDAERVLGLLERAQPESISLRRLRDLLAQPEPATIAATTSAPSTDTTISANPPNAAPTTASIQQAGLPTTGTTTTPVAAPTAAVVDNNRASSMPATTTTLASVTPPVGANSQTLPTTSANSPAQPSNRTAATGADTTTTAPPVVQRAPHTPVVLSQAAPRYPPRALKQKLEGWVLVGFTIRPDGRVDDVSVLNAEPAGVFDREAVGSMQRWQFQPPGQAITAQRRIDFKLGR